MIKKHKKIYLSFLKSINKIILITTIATIILFGFMVLVFAIQDRFSEANKSSIAVTTIINVLVITLPIVFFLVCIIVSSVFSSHLFKKGVYVQKLSRLESLQNIDVLLVNNNGSLTDGTFEIKKVIPLKASASEECIAQFVSNALYVVESDNQIIKALRRKYDLELSSEILTILPFDAENLCFGATFKGGKTIVVGNLFSIPIVNRNGVIRRCEEIIDSGHQVLVVAEGKEQIVNGECIGELEASALIVLKSHIRKDAFETFKLLKNSNTDIKVISSGDDIFASVIAAEAGVDNSDKHISLEGMSIDEIKEIVNDYTVFGRITVEQEKIIVEVLKKEGLNVAVIGATIGDVPAMKNADCAFAVANADDNAKQAADFIMNEPSFSSLPLAINESKKLISNMQKVSVLYLTKTIFALTLLLIFSLTSLFANNSDLQFPFVFNHIIFCDVFINGVAAFVLATSKEDEQINGMFLKNVIKKAIVNASMLIVSVCLIFIFYLMQQNTWLNLGIYSFDTAVAMSVLTFNILSIVILYSLCSPLNKSRAIVLSSSALIIVLSIITTLIVTYLSNQPDVVLQIPYLEMSGPAYITTAIIIVVFSAIYIFIHKLSLIHKGDKSENEN